MDSMDHLDAASSSVSDNEERDIQPLSAATLEAALLDSQAFELENELENELEAINHDCPHLVSALSIETNKVSMLKKYKSAVGWAAYNLSSGGRPRKRRKISVPTCQTCGSILHRPFICLECPYGGCWRGEHIQNHMRDLGHRFCADVKSGSIFCSECDDFIQNKTMDDLYHLSVLSAEEKETRFALGKITREPFRPWIPDDIETAALRDATTLPCHARRGLLNLGQTCFLNVVLQVLVHNPLLRNYFLSDRHNYKLCKSKECMCCELDKLFAEIYSPDNSSPFGPIALLATTWRSSKELAGYAQQDAHEFFISALNQIHTSSRGSTEVSCNCVVHNVFAGQLQSDVKCEKCGNVVNTVEPLLDVSLDLSNVKGRHSQAAQQENTLAGCLERYTQSEKLISKYTCSKCSTTSQTATKRLSIKKLPPILSIQLKRFAHKPQDKSTAARKIDKYIRYPARLNMAPYTTLAAHSQDKDQAQAKDLLGPDAAYDYDLFAVINHEGQIDNGHYTNFARSQDEWYRFDDEKVSHATLDVVLQSTAYMLFYAKRHLDYKPYTRPSYVVTRETEAVKEKQKEREKAVKEEQKEKEKEAARMKEVEDALLATV